MSNDDLLNGELPYFNNLAKLDRRARGMTQQQYARAVGVKTATAVSLWEANKRRVPENVIHLLINTKLPKFVKCEHCQGTGIVRATNE